MHISRKLVSIAAGVTLVAGVGMAAAPAASAKTKYSGTTEITLNQKVLQPFADAIAIIRPATSIRRGVSFPVTGVSSPEVFHRGALEVGDIRVSNPVIVVGDNNTAIVTATSPLGQVELFTIKKFSIRSDTRKQQVWKGNLHLTTNQTVVDLLNASGETDVFTPGMRMGAIKTTIDIRR